MKSGNEEQGDAPITSGRAVERSMALRPLSAVVMAAGEGSRMRSSLPKPLHAVCGRPILLHVLDALSELLVDRAVVVVGWGAERVTKTLLEDGPGGRMLKLTPAEAPR